MSITLDGTNFLSTPDINLLDADTAHLEQSIGGWEGAFGLGYFAQSTGLASAFGTYVGEFTVSTTSASTTAIRTPWDGDVAAPGDVKTIRARLAQAIGVSGPYEARVTIRFTDGASSLQRTDSGWKALTTALQSFVLESDAAPASTTNVSIQIEVRLVSGAGRVAGDTFYLDGQMLIDGVEADLPVWFVPSMRIVGNPDMRIKVSLDSTVPAASNGLMSKYETTADERSFRFLLTPSGQLQLIVSANGIATNSHSSTVNLSTAISAGDVAWIRATKVLDNGAAGNTTQFFTSASRETWTQLGEDVTTAGVISIYPGVAPFDIGVDYNSSVGLLSGAVFETELRDGIDGPVVVNFNADDVPGDLNPGDTFVGRDGRTYTAAGTNPIIKAGAEGQGNNVVMLR